MQVLRLDRRGDLAQDDQIVDDANVEKEIEMSIADTTYSAYTANAANTAWFL